MAGDAAIEALEAEEGLVIVPPLSLFFSMIVTPEDLFRVEYVRLLSIAKGILRNREDAEDCVQDTLVYICRGYGVRAPARHQERERHRAAQAHIRPG
jgi:hypothetical protein